jgi:L-lactate dehydrogenase
LDLLKINAQIFSEIVPQIIKYAPGSILIVASNPLDIMTEITLKLSNFDSSRVIGSGTVLDSARFVVELAQFFEISEKSIDAYVLGEHGDSEVLVWSQARVGMLTLDELASTVNRELTNDVRSKIDDDVRNAAYKIISGKRATFYGIAGALGKICHSILSDSNAVLPVSVHHGEIEGVNNICLAMPTVINRSGAVKVLSPNLSSGEHQALGRSAKIIKEYTEQILAEI